MSVPFNMVSQEEINGEIDIWIDQIKKIVVHILKLPDSHMVDNCFQKIVASKTRLQYNIECQMFFDLCQIILLSIYKRDQFHTRDMVYKYFQDKYNYRKLYFVTRNLIMKNKNGTGKKIKMAIEENKNFIYDRVLSVINTIERLKKTFTPAKKDYLKKQLLFTQDDKYVEYDIISSMDSFHQPTQVNDMSPENVQDAAQGLIKLSQSVDNSQSPLISPNPNSDNFNSPNNHASSSVQSTQYSPLIINHSHSSQRPVFPSHTSPSVQSTQYSPLISPNPNSDNFNSPNNHTSPSVQSTQYSPEIFLPPMDPSPDRLTLQNHLDDYSIFPSPDRLTLQNDLDNYSKSNSKSKILITRSTCR